MLAAGGTVFVPASCPRSPKILPRGIADPSSTSGLPGTDHSDIALGVALRLPSALGEVEQRLGGGVLVGGDHKLSSRPISPHIQTLENG